MEKWECVVEGRGWGTARGPGVWTVCMGLGRNSHSGSPGEPGTPGPCLRWICCPPRHSMLQGSPLTRRPLPFATSRAHSGIEGDTSGWGWWYVEGEAAVWTHVGGPRGLLGAQVWLLVSEQSFGSLFPTRPDAPPAHRSWEGLRGRGAFLGRGL